MATRQTECSQVVKNITAVVWGMVKCGIAEYRCGMAIGLRLGSEDRVGVMARAWVTVTFRVVFCSNIAQFLTILHILHCTETEWVMAVRVMVMVRVSLRVYVMNLFCRSIVLFSVFYAFVAVMLYVSRKSPNVVLTVIKWYCLIAVTLACTRPPPETSLYY